MKIWKKKAGSVALLQSFASLILVGSIGTTLMFQNAPIITQALNQESSKIIEGAQSETDNVYFKPDYDDLKKLQADETVFAEQVQAEGSVLLQNKGLPLAKNAKITLLGSGSADGAFYISGGGSAAIDTKRKPSMVSVFEEAGFRLNPVMLDFYSDGNGVSTASKGSNYVGEAPQSAYSANEINSYSDYNDAAVVFISRMGQEGKDVATNTFEDANKTMLELSQNEMDLIDSALKHFSNVVVLLNTMNPMEIACLQEKNVSVLWVGAGGQQGLRAIPKLLNGTYNPSGRLVDTYACDNFSSPAMVNFGNFMFENTNQKAKDYYYNYAENIYVGYKYYETRYADYVMKQGNAGEYSYTDQVVYPYGYGLSYTQFSYSDFSIQDKKDIFEVSVKVTNEGNTTGKEVVQVYLQKPYTDYDKRYHIEKSATELADFGRTDELKAGQSQTLTLQIEKESLRSYDAENKKTYIVEEGDY